MTEAAPVGGGGLREGWTQHDHNGTVFYFHAATNTLQQERPVELPPPLSTAAESQPGYYSAEEATRHPQSMAAAFQAPVMQTVGVQPQGYSAVAPMRPAAMPVASVPPNVPSGRTPETATGPMKQIQVLVPQPGAAVGQQLVFDIPSGGPGQAPRSMAVTLQEEVAAGSVISVQYPMSSPAGAVPGPLVCGGGTTHAVQHAMLPQPTVRMTDNVRSMGWILYAIGWILVLIGWAPCGLAAWTIGCAVYFCKPPHHRVTMPHQRTPAYTSLITCIAVPVVWILILLTIWSMDDVPAPWTPPRPHSPSMQHEFDVVDNTPMPIFRSKSREPSSGAEYIIAS